MAGVRRRLRDVGARVTGVLGALRDEVVGAAEEQGPAGAAPGEEGADGRVGETGDVPTAAPHTAETSDAGAPAAGTAATETAAGVTDAPTADPAAAVEPDRACAAAVDLAREAAVVEGGRRVGEHLGARAEEGDPLVVTHAFACTDPAYVGWHWAVTVARAEGADVVTVDEVVLLPGPDALLAPAWVPYSDRVRPGDLGTGDLLPPAPDDPRLVPAVADPEQLVEDLVWELGLGRPRVLSVEGRADAAERWHDGETGPGSPRAKAAPGRCGDCGFLVPLGGSLRAAFGACANALAPDDGRVVALDHGCGAHSEQPVELVHVPAGGAVADEPEYDVVERDTPDAAGAAEEPEGPTGA